MEILNLDNFYQLQKVLLVKQDRNSIEFRFCYINESKFELLKKIMKTSVVKLNFITHLNKKDFKGNKFQ
jgi:hypothetical protein